MLQNENPYCVWLTAWEEGQRHVGKQLYLGSEIQLYTLLFIFESLGSTYMYCYRNCLHNYNFIN